MRKRKKKKEPTAKLVSRKRSRETTAGASVAQKPSGVPLIGKQSNLRSLYRFSPEAKKKTPEKKGVVIKDPLEPAQKRPKVTIKPLKTAGVESEKEKTAGKPMDKVAEKEKEKVVETAAEKEKEKVSEKPIGSDRKESGAAATTAHEKAHGPEVVHVTRLDQPVHEKRKGPEVEKKGQFVQLDAPLQTAKVTSTGEPGSSIHKEKSAAAGGAGPGGAGGFVPQSPIGPKDIVGDLYYKTYTEEAHGNAPHQAPWGLKQKDTFMEFGACRDWFL
ncbi:hypothetical protein HanHA300_Chr01g0016911 [Helianthus annuus]|nr:hypothetical protein HanHA300_Chr01g0016911 [Helianthus annuus]